MSDRVPVPVPLLPVPLLLHREGGPQLKRRKRRKKKVCLSRWAAGATWFGSGVTLSRIFRQLTQYRCTEPEEESDEDMGFGLFD
jgi:hypothetical protein